MNDTLKPDLSRKDFVLACLATCPSHTYTPVQLQKLFFLADKLGNQVGGPYFHFQPYHYGPFDKGVYDELESLERANCVEIVTDDRLKMTKYRLRVSGEEIGEAVLDSLPAIIRDYLALLKPFLNFHLFDTSNEA